MDELTTRLAEALRLAAQELNAIRARDGAPQHVQWGPNGRAFVTDACTHEWWDQLTEQCHEAVDAYDSALAAEREAHEQATAKLLGTDDNGQFGVGA